MICKSVRGAVNVVACDAKCEKDSIDKMVRPEFQDTGAGSQAVELDIHVILAKGVLKYCETREVDEY